MIEHPNATYAREAFASLWQDGDFGPALERMSEDVHWVNDIGAGPWHEMRGKTAVVEMLAGWMGFFDGGFEQQLIDVLANDDRIIEVIREVGQARGQTFDNLALYHLLINAEGFVTEVRTFDRDREAIVAFWDAVGPVVPASSMT